MTLFRQGGLYVLIGLLQLLADWLVFVAVTAAGLPVVPGNVTGRIAGAVLGFWLNGRYTFAGTDGHRLGMRRFGRFALVWLLMTVLSTLLVSCLASRLGMQQAWLGKPLVEAALAVLSFVLMRHVVYR